MEQQENLYNTIAIILTRLESEGNFVFQDLSPLEEKAIVLLLQNRVIISSTRIDPNSIYPGENFSEMLEIGPNKFFELTEKLKQTRIMRRKDVLNLTLLRWGAIGAIIGGALVGTLFWFFGCA